MEEVTIPIVNPLPPDQRNSTYIKHHHNEFVAIAYFE